MHDHLNPVRSAEASSSGALARARGARWLAAGGFSVWLGVSSLVGAKLVVTHAMTGEGRGLSGLSLPEDCARVSYVLGADCGLSEALADGLVRRGPRRGLREEVWLVADEPELALRLSGAGYRVERAERAELAELKRSAGVRGAPWVASFDSRRRLISSRAFFEP